MVNADPKIETVADLAVLLEQAALAVNQVATGLECAQKALGSWTVALTLPELPDVIAQVWALAEPIALAQNNLMLARALDERSRARLH